MGGEEGNPALKKGEITQARALISFKTFKLLKREGPARAHVPSRLGLAGRHKRAPRTPKIKESDPTSLQQNVDLVILHRLVRSMSRNSDLTGTTDDRRRRHTTTTT